MGTVVSTISGDWSRQWSWATYLGGCKFPLFQILTMEGILAKIICPIISGHTLSLAGFGFVNDVDLCITLPSHNCTKLVTQIQNWLRMWAGLLHAMGAHWYQENVFGILSTINGKMAAGITQNPLQTTVCKHQTIQVGMLPFHNC